MVSFPLTTMGSTHLFPGKFFMGINFNGSPYQADPDKSIVVYTQNSLLTPKVGLSLPGASNFYTLYGMCRCAAVKIRYVPQHQNDGSSIALWRPGYIHYDYDGHEAGMYGQSLNNLVTHGNFKIKNMERPWKYYKKSKRYRVLTKIPTPEQGDPTVGGQNIAGMWHGVGDAIADTGGLYGSHIQFMLDTVSTTPAYTLNDFEFGRVFVTVYMVYKDRLS